MPTLQEFLMIELPAMTAAIFAGIACGLIGSLLVLRRQSMMGDAISHAVLPGIVMAFLITESRSSLPMVIGAVVSVSVAALLIELVHRLGKVEMGASMGVVFTVMFALGVMLLERGGAHSVDLDPSCVLYGQLEHLFWIGPQTWGDLIKMEHLRGLPVEVITLAVVALVTLLFVGLFWKELKITSFDPALASTLGIPSGLVHALLVLMVAVVAVASFFAVGSILVVALLICPGATARMLTDRYGVHLFLSALIGAVTAVVGYILGAFGPQWLGHGISVSTSGMIAVTNGLVLGLAILLSPRHGLLAKAFFANRASEKEIRP